MTDIPQSIKLKNRQPAPDIDQFIGVITGKAKPKRLHLAELFADQEVMKWITEDILEKQWVPMPQDPSKYEQAKQHLLCLIEYWYRMGYDYIRLSGGVDFDVTLMPAGDTAGQFPRDRRQWAKMTDGKIKNYSDFESFDWPIVKDENFWQYHFIAENLPEKMGLFVCPRSGFLEIPMKGLIGLENMAFMAVDNPDLLEAVFKKVGQILIEACEKLIEIPHVAGFFHGDDMGYKTGLLVGPDFLKKHVLPGHKQVVDLAHSRQKIYILHSCGNLEAIMDYLIDHVGIDAKHSYEDVIMPVEDFYSRYAGRVGILGGVDVDLLARADEETVRKRVQKMLTNCHRNGRYAFGTGNTITNYCKKENILAMFDQAYRFSG